MPLSRPSPAGRIALIAVAGLLLGLAVHVVTLLTLPRLATEDVYDRYAGMAPVNGVALVAATAPGSEPIPNLDPNFAVALCRFDLGKGPIRITVPLSPHYTSLALYSRRGTPFYALNDRAAGRRLIEFTLMTQAQRAALATSEDETPADNLFVVAPVATGIAVFRALAVEPGAMAAIRAGLAEAKCAAPPPSAVTPAPAPPPGVRPRSLPIEVPPGPPVPRRALPGETPRR